MRFFSSSLERLPAGDAQIHSASSAHQDRLFLGLISILEIKNIIPVHQIRHVYHSVELYFYYECLPLKGLNKDFQCHSLGPKRTRDDISLS